MPGLDIGSLSMPVLEAGLMPHQAAAHLRRGVGAEMRWKTCVGLYPCAIAAVRGAAMLMSAMCQWLALVIDEVCSVRTAVSTSQRLLAPKHVSLRRRAGTGILIYLAGELL